MLGMACSKTTLTSSKLCASPGETPNAIAVNTSPKEAVCIAFLMDLRSLWKCLVHRLGSDEPAASAEIAEERDREPSASKRSPCGAVPAGVTPPPCRVANHNALRRRGRRPLSFVDATSWAASTEWRQRLARCDGAFRLAHDLLYFNDGNAARDQLPTKGKINDAISALIALNLRLQGFDNLIATLLVGNIGQRNPL